MQELARNDINSRGSVTEAHAEYWQEYEDFGDVGLRNRLVEHYLPIVRYQAERVHRRLPSSVELDDVMSAGIFGLLEAIDNFDLAHKVKFKTYCTRRIRGAILDALRKDDWVPRLVRSQANKLNAAVRELEQKLGEEPSDEQLASHMNISRAELEKLVRSATPKQVVSLSDSMRNDENGRTVTTGDLVSDSKELGPLEHLQRSDFMATLALRLNDKERLILVLYYFEGMTMKEVGFILNLSESRVCQLHSKILDSLQREFEFDDFLDPRLN